MVGNVNHYYNRKLVEILKVNYTNLRIDFFSTSQPYFKNCELPYNKIYDGSIIKNKIPLFFRVRGLFGMYSHCFFVKGLNKVLEENEYDFVHLQYAESWVDKVIKKNVNRKIKLIVTIWGSDFYRASAFSKKKLASIFNIADIITFQTNRISNDFNAVYHTGNKHRIVTFGLNAFTYIDNYRNSINTKDISKYIITVGYNRHPAQQHIGILEAIEKLDSNYKQKITLKIPFTYGPVNKNYNKRINSILNKINIKYNFLNDFLSEEEIAIECLKSDIMIQVQITDSFSGSMLEYMYAGKVVVTGSWLRYDDLTKEGVYFETINKIEDLTDKLKYIIDNYEILYSKCYKNKDILNRFSSWENNIQKWRDLYN